MSAPRIDPRRLGKTAQTQIANTHRSRPDRSRSTASSGVLLECCTPGCLFPRTSNLTAMEAHCDDIGHHRYKVVLDAV